MRFFVLVFSVLVLAVPVVAREFTKGFEAYQRGDFAAALQEWRPLAEQGNTSAQGIIGYMYHNGQGPPKDYVQAHMWYSIAARKGDRHAAGNRDSIATEMTRGDVSRAQRLAREWMEKHGK